MAMTLRLIPLLALVAAIVPFVGALECNGTYGSQIGSAYFTSHECIAASKSTPWCLRQVTNAPNSVPRYFCSECATRCHCGPRKYCSKALDETFGTCVSFKQEGTTCVPFTDVQLTNSSLQNKYMCADTFSDQASPRPRLIINHQGFCREGTCRFCSAGLPSPTVSTSSYECTNVAGSEIPRFCEWPGHYIGASNAAWDPLSYGQDVTAVWLAVFYVFFVISLFICCGRLAVSIKTG